jgi:hypothetical protein
MDANAYDALEKRIEELDEAIEAMKRAETAGQIARGSLKSVEKALRDVKSSLPEGGGGLDKVSGALEEIAVALGEQARIAARAEAKASTKERIPSPEVTRAVDWIADATGYTADAVRQPERIFWIDPRSAAVGHTINLYSTGGISEVAEIRVGGITVNIVVRADHVEFEVPNKPPGDVLRRGIAKIEVDLEETPGQVARAAWTTELDLRASLEKAVT